MFFMEGPIFLPPNAARKSEVGADRRWLGLPLQQAESGRTATLRHNLRWMDCHAGAISVTLSGIHDKLMTEFFQIQDRLQ
jgi:hypothetical protein